MKQTIEHNLSRRHFNYLRDILEDNYDYIESEYSTKKYIYSFYDPYRDNEFFEYGNVKIIITDKQLTIQTDLKASIKDFIALLEKQINNHIDNQIEEYINIFSDTKPNLDRIYLSHHSNLKDINIFLTAAKIHYENIGNKNYARDIKTFISKGFDKNYYSFYESLFTSLNQFNKDIKYPKSLLKAKKFCDKHYDK